MLFVDHAERQLAHSHPLLNQRMRSEHGADFPTREPAQNLFARRTRDSAGQKCALYVEPRTRARESPVVLLGKKLRRRHHCRLMSAFHRAKHRPERNNRFTAADVTHQQAVHLVRARKVGAYLIDREYLRSRQRKRQLSQHSLTQALRAIERKSNPACAADALNRKRELECEEFIERERLMAARLSVCQRLDVSVGRRIVKVVQRLAHRGYLVAQFFRQRSPDRITRLGQRACYQTREQALSNDRRQSVNGADSLRLAVRQPMQLRLSDL